MIPKAWYRAPKAVRPSLFALRRAPKAVRPSLFALRRAPKALRLSIFALRRAPNAVRLSLILSPLTFYLKPYTFSVIAIPFFVCRYRPFCKATGKLLDN
jgi:hypothetical protein